MAKLYAPRSYISHGNGRIDRAKFAKLGPHVIIEDGVMVFHPENIEIGCNVYIGHGTFLKGYFKNRLQIGDNTWIGQQCFLHSGGGIKIGSFVGIGPRVMILSHQHKIDGDPQTPVVLNEQIYSPVIIGDGCDIGVGTIILPGVEVGEGSVIGAGSVVTRSVDPFSIAFGNPARIKRKRNAP